MNGTDESWPAQAVPIEMKEQLFAQALTYDAEMRHMARDARRAGWIVGCIGMLIGIAGFGVAVSLLPLKTTELRWIAVDQSTGWVGDPVGAADAPHLFSEQVRQQYLRQLIEACESYSADTADLLWHRCLVFLSPEAQQDYDARIGTKNPNAPRNALARRGSVRIEESFRFDLQPEVKKDVFGYTVRFFRTEVLNGQPARPLPWAATVYFEWHPDWAMTPQDRALNTAGFYALSYKAEPERVP